MAVGELESKKPLARRGVLLLARRQNNVLDLLYLEDNLLVEALAGGHTLNKTFWEGGFCNNTPYVQLHVKTRACELEREGGKEGGREERGGGSEKHWLTSKAALVSVFSFCVQPLCWHKSWHAARPAADSFL